MRTPSSSTRTASSRPWWWSWLAAVLWQALRRLRSERLLVCGSVVAVLLVLVQAALGGLTVEHGLRAALVAAHLGTAMLLLGTLIALAVAARPRRTAAAPARQDCASSRQCPVDFCWQRWWPAA